MLRWPLPGGQASARRCPWSKVLEPRTGPVRSRGGPAGWERAWRPSWRCPAPPTSSPSPAGSPTRRPSPATSSPTSWRDCGLGRRQRPCSTRRPAACPDPRAYLAGAAGRAGGAPPAEAELMITSGGIEALELAGQGVPGPRRPGPGRGADVPRRDHGVPELRGRRSEAVPMDARRPGGGSLEQVLRAGRRPKLLYTIPDYQNPAGVSLRRSGASGWSSWPAATACWWSRTWRTASWDSTSVRLPSLWSLAPDTVVQCGTYSKTFFPGVRLGWAAGPAEVIDQLCWPSRTPTSAPARSASGSWRSTAPGAPGGAGRPGPGALPPAVLADAGGPRPAHAGGGHVDPAHGWLLLLADASRAAWTPPSWPGRRCGSGWPSFRGLRSTPTGAGGTSFAWPSARWTTT